MSRRDINMALEALDALRQLNEHQRQIIDDQKRVIDELKSKLDEFEG